MRIGVISDSHGNRTGLKDALRLLTNLDVDAVLHCGDICCLDSLQMLVSLNIQSWLVAGNMDSHLVRQLIAKSKGTTVTFHPSTVEIPLENGEFLIATHGDNFNMLEELISGQNFPYICQGHIHRACDVMHGSSRLVCPGAISDPRYPKFATAAVIDSASDTVIFYDIFDGAKVEIMR